jgi:hypothetical protein
MLKVMLIFIVGIGLVFSQNFTTPYEKDENTVLLMHFDDDLTNETDVTEDGQGQGKLSYISGLSNFNKAVWINNDSPSDTSMISVPHTEELNLQGSFTIEGWMNPITFTGEPSPVNPRHQPALISKGYPEFRSYYVLMKSGRVLEGAVNYQDYGEYTNPILGDDAGVIQLENWYHFTFIRDTENNTQAFLLHNSDGELIGTDVRPDLEEDLNNPETPLLFGVHDWYEQDEYYNGLLDEVRISDVVRDYQVPAVFADVSTGGNGKANEDLAVEADVRKVGDIDANSVSNVTLHYKTPGSGWQTTSMSNSSGTIYSANIPGQPVGSKVLYYVEAETNGGTVSYFPREAESAESYAGVGFWEQDENTLSVTFEEGEGTPIDNSEYSAGNSLIPVGNNLSYSEDTAPGAEGDYSYSINEDPNLPDTSYLKLEKPTLFINPFDNLGWHFDLWVKVDSSTAPDTGEYDWQGQFVRWEEKDSDYNSIQVGGNSFMFRDRGADNVFLGLPEGYEMAGNWYHVIFGVAQDHIFVEVRDENDSLLTGGKGYRTDQDYTLDYSLSWISFGHHPREFKMFKGKLDNIKFYNYPVEIDTGATGIDQRKQLPEKVELSQNYPNPFNPTTTIKFSLPTQQKVNLAVYNLIGQKVVELASEKFAPGTHSIIWDAKNSSGSTVSSGMYFYKLQTKNVTKMKKMILMR